MSSTLSSPTGVMPPVLARNLEAGVARGAGLAAARMLFAAVMIGLGARGLYFGDFAGVWQHVPVQHLPGHDAIAYACALLELGAGIGLLVKSAVRICALALCAYLLLWIVLLKLPVIVQAPLVEVSWLGAAEIAVILAGAWIVHAITDSRRSAIASVRNARLLFAVALLPIGLSHFVYAQATAGFVPSWLPSPTFWAYFTGAGSLATACALLCGVLPRLASALEAAMLSVITLLVWLPGLLRLPSNESWTPLLISSAIAAGAWVVAASYGGVGWLAGTRSHRRD
jgi:uncharacterized membrane protein YphA (DoxX/SURF4 family)